MKTIPSMKRLRATAAAQTRAIKRTHKKIDMLVKIEQLKQARVNATIDLIQQLKSGDPLYAS
jgi:hypothetical protein